MLVDSMGRGRCDNTIGVYQAFKGSSEWEAMLTAKSRAAKILLSCRLVANFTQNRLKPGLIMVMSGEQGIMDAPGPWEWADGGTGRVVAE